VSQIDELIETFTAASRRHFVATVEGDYKIANREVDRINEAFLKLRELGPDAREALILVAASSDAAAVMAAAYSLKYDPERSLKALKRLSRDSGLLGFKAAQAIKRWKSGEWQLE
jgi:hypothetical protein